MSEEAEGIVVEGICRVLETIVCVPAPEPVVPDAFTSTMSPRISIRDYVVRIHETLKHPECLVLAIAYLDSFLRHRPAMRLNTHNIHRLFASAVLLSHKFLDDDCFSNDDLRLVFGVSLNDLNAMEAEMFALLADHMFVSDMDFQEIYELFEKWELSEECVQ